MAREPEAIAERRRALGVRLATFRQAADLTQGQLARMAFCDRTRVVHIEKGRAGADERFWRVVDEACDAQGVLLTAYLELDATKAEYERNEREQRLAAVRAEAAELRSQAGRKAQSGIVLFGAGSSSAQVRDEPVDDDALFVNSLAIVDLLALAWMLGSLDQRMDRRDVHQLAATLAVIPALGVADLVERIACALTRSTGVTEDMVEHLETRSIGFHRLESVLPAGQIFRSLLAHLNEITTLLQVCPQSQDKLRTRLARTAGETAVLGAWLAWDLGDVQRAASLYHTAELAAKESSDSAILACSVIYRSFELAEAGEHLVARQRLADARQALPQHGDLATRAWLLGREAEEMAAMRDPAAKGMIEKASDLLIQARTGVERSWTRCLEPNLTHMRLAIATRLADEPGVHKYVGDLTALACDPTQKKTGRILASIGLALVAVGDVHEGIQAGQRSLEAVRTSQARYALDRLTELGAAFTGSSSQERDLRESIRAIRQEFLSPRPPTSGRRPGPH